MIRNVRHALVIAGASLAVFAALAGCQTWAPNDDLIRLTAQGEHGRASEVAFATLPADRNDVDYGLASMRMGMAALADGQVGAAETPLLAMYEILRTQGINDGNGMGIFFRNEEDLIYWKGEPFEQAMGYAYFSAQLASVGDWYNANIAASNAIFQLANFEEVVGKVKEEQLAAAESDEERARIEERYADVDPASIAAAAETWERERAAKRRSDAPNGAASEDDADSADEPNFFADAGYVPEETNFAVGYMMQGVTAFAAGNSVEDVREASDAFRKAWRYAPSTRPVSEDVLNGRANTVFWVDFGPGPEKFRYGYAEAFAKFKPRAEGASPLRASLSNRGGAFREDGAIALGSGADSFEPIANLNEYAGDHRWLNLQNARVAKAALGDALIVGGAIVAAQADDAGQALAGLVIMGVGALQKEGAKADIRHNEILPQRVYFVALDIHQPTTTVSFEVEGRPGSRLVLPGVDPPDPEEKLQFRYVRLNDTRIAPDWATSGVVYYANPSYSEAVPGDDLPYVMGGTCVRPPSAETLSWYQQNGNLLGVSLNELESVYRAEGLTWRLGDQNGVSFLHVLEGGASLIAPLDGTAGFARLFCQQHPPYVPRSEALQAFIERHIAQPTPTPAVAEEVRAAVAESP